jgi:hypothetical protein
VFHEVYTALRAQYELAISELRSFKKERRFWADPVERLAHHMVIAYAYRMGGDKDALWLNIESILSTLYSSGDIQAIEVAESVIDHLTKLGFERYRSHKFIVGFRPGLRAPNYFLARK